MTPKEKAEELVKKYSSINYDLNDVENHKEGALIAVDEVLKMLDDNSYIKYWLMVKYEIEKLWKQ
jgi:hypothetical protein